MASKMTMPIIFTSIKRVVVPGWIGRYKSIPDLLGVCPDARFVFNDHHGCGGVLDEYRDRSRMDFRVGYGFLNAARDIFNLSVTLHIDANVATLDGHATYLKQATVSTGVPVWKVDGHVRR